MWQPATRGVNSNPEFCHYKECQKHNSDTNRYIVDSVGPRFFCDDHWVLMGFLFKLVASCDLCTRNHAADWSRDEITIDSAKYQNKWWELCNRHYEIYDDLIMLILPLEED